MLLHHALTEPAAENRAYQNRDHGDEERAGVDVVEHAIDVCRVPATRLKARRVGVLHEPQGQNRAGQAVGEHHIADEQQRLALVFAGAGDEIGGHREYDAGDKRKHEMSGNEKEQADDHAHDGDAAELAESRGQQHVHAAGDEGCNGRQEDGAEAAGKQGAYQRGDAHHHEVQGREYADGDEVGDLQFAGFGGFAGLVGGFGGRVRCGYDVFRFI